MRLACSSQSVGFSDPGSISESSTYFKLEYIYLVLVATPKYLGHGNQFFGVHLWGLAWFALDLNFRTKFLSDDWMEEKQFIEPDVHGAHSTFW